MAQPVSLVSSSLNTSHKLKRLFYKYTEESTSDQKQTQPKPAKAYESYAPYNFTWFVQGKVAAMAWPQTVENLNYIADQGVDHLVTLSPEKVPPILECEKKMKWTQISIKEFGAPTLQQIIKFIAICERAEIRGETVGVHCRQGRGRTGTLLACYLVHFRDMPPERAILTVRLQRPGSCETYEQERSVCHYHDCVRGTVDRPDYRLIDDKAYFDETMAKIVDVEDKPKPDGDEFIIKDGDEYLFQDGGAKDGGGKVEEKEKKVRKKSTAMVIHHKIYF